MSLAKTVRMNQLFDFYAQLLTKKQQEMLRYYYEEDYSLAEIADHYQISRQAVHDNLKRGEKSLEQFEKKLQLFSKQQQRKDYYLQLKELLNSEEAMHILEKLQTMN